MDINSISNELINLNQNTQAPVLNIEETISAKEVSKDDALNLSISDVYNKKRDELSISLQSLNEGIAINQISKDGLVQQEEQLNKVEDKLNTAKGTLEEGIDTNSLKEDILKDLIQFNQIADTTTFKNEKLLTLEKNQAEEVTISTQQSVYTLEKAETKEISSTLAKNFESNDLSSETEIDTALDATSDAKTKVSNFISKIDDIDKRIVENAQNTITDQIDLSKENSALTDVDFGAETSDFSKTNINSQLGFLAGTQAHIVQEQSVRLLKT